MSHDVGRTAPDRTYLSIREVLELLVGEFPDVTISKIRFLESRGLIHPERTPSGYRKFYEHDVDRLRWILRQQREHFLPLKVIKGRLENSSAPSLFDADVLLGEEIPCEAPLGGAGITELEVPTADVRLGNHSPRTALDRRSSLGSSRVEAGHSVEDGREPSRAVAHPVDPGGAGMGQAGPAAKAVQAVQAAVATKPESDVAGSDVAGSGAAVSLGGLTGQCFSVEELASASGTNEALVAELEEFGLVAGRTVAGVHVYDEDALLVVRLAAGFRRFGIEARHLRVFKHAAEREAGLFTQVVTPLLRQRNPAARERAERDLCELTELGTSIQSAFLRCVLRDLTGG